MKTIDEAKERLQGFFNIAVTPFAQDGAIDFAVLAVNLERMMSLGVDGFLIGGTYGEFATMTGAERAELFRAVVRIVGDRVPIMLCSASADPREAAELTRLAAELGCVPMMTPPFVSEVTDEQVVGFFAHVGGLSRTGVVIYNAPGVGATLSPEMIERLSELAPVIGLKQGDLAPTAIDRIANRLGGRLRLFCASDLAFLGPLLCGFHGVSSTNSCALPELIKAIFDALQRGDAAEARALHRNWFPVRETARRFGQPQTVKALMRLRGWNGGHVRAPLRDLSDAQIEVVAGALREVPARWRHV